VKSDLEKYTARRKRADKAFAKGFDTGYEKLKQSLREAVLIKRGRMKPGRVFRVEPESKSVRVQGASARTPNAASR
jgi:hypothetical protein